MAYTELIKNFNRTRDYMRDFYVYGFKSRDDFTGKSLRSYDNEKRRVESWLNDYMGFRDEPNGKKVFISIDSKDKKRNPLFNPWKAKSFTGISLTLHFLIFDILHSPEISMTLNDLTYEIDERLSLFQNPLVPDRSTIRKKLNDLEKQGLLSKEKKGNTIYYSRIQDTPLPPADMIHFFSEIAPCGVVGSFILDRYDDFTPFFTFKHHYITGTLDSEILYSFLLAIREKKDTSVKFHSDKGTTPNDFLPLEIRISVRSGREYVMGYSRKYNKICSYRLDSIETVKIKDNAEDFNEKKKVLDSMKPHIFGVSTHSFTGNPMETVEFTISYGENEEYIPKRLNREKRCGCITFPEKGLCKYTAEVYDSWELVPWIRTYICRITDIHFSNKKLEKQFKRDLEAMYQLYEIKEGERE